MDEAKNIFFTGGGRRNVTIDMELDLPWVMADRRRIVQVLCNLLSNAARYSPESAPIRVNASLGDDRVEMSVADEGLGVSPDEMPLLLFRKFSRNIGHGAEREAPDTGLGLAICKGIVEGSRRPHLGRKRWIGTGLHVHLHPAVGRRRRRRGRESRSERQVANGGQKPDADSGGGRRSDGPPVCAGRPLQGGLCSGCDHRSERGPPHSRERTGPAWCCWT